jgi:hypothetical protein
MKLAAGLILVVVFSLGSVSSEAQNPNYNVGPVWRVIYIHINPGQGDAFWNDVRQNLKPIWDDQKQQGLIIDYKLYTNPVLNRADDWSVAIAIQYPNWAALDQLAAKGETISIKRYGSREAMIAANKKRSEMGTVISNQLAREVTLK